MYVCSKNPEGKAARPHPSGSFLPEFGIRFVSNLCKKRQAPQWACPFDWYEKRKVIYFWGSKIQNQPSLSSATR